jgi:hypothetical protein
VHPATLADVLHIGEEMWDRGREELRWLLPPDQWLEGWKRRIARGDAVAFDSHAILGCDWEAPGTICTSFQAAKSFEDPGVGLRITKEIRREIPRLMQERGIHLVCTYSLCVHPESEKWFRLLGLTEDTSYRGVPRGPYTSRRFVRRR